MFNSPIIDLVILLSFTYFIGSLMLTVINEAIAATLRLRAKGLKKTLENLVFDPAWQIFVQKILIHSPHIQSLQNDVKKYPSYIPARNFVLTIIEQLRAGGYTSTTIITAIKSSAIPPIFQGVLLDLWDKAQARATPTLTAITVFEEELENYYNSAMERASGWYKRSIRRILLTLGTVLAMLLNLDTIGIANSSLKDKNKLKATVDNIVANLDKISVNDSIITITDTTNGVFINQIFKTDTSNQDIKSIAHSTKSSISDLSIYYKQTTDISLGYKDWNEAKKLWFNVDANNKRLGETKDGWLAFFVKLLGILITAFALQLGSNYWFDILNKAVNMRAAGKKPGEEKNKTN